MSLLSFPEWVLFALFAIFPFPLRRWESSRVYDVSVLLPQDLVPVVQCDCTLQQSWSCSPAHSVYKWQNHEAQCCRDGKSQLFPFLFSVKFVQDYYNYTQDSLFMILFENTFLHKSVLQWCESAIRTWIVALFRHVPLHLHMNKTKSRGGETQQLYFVLISCGISYCS